MIKNFTDITFTKEVKDAQEKWGSRHIYEKVEKRGAEENRIYHRERELIEEMDGFYMATANEDGWPYVQFRGGPKGFLKVIDEQTMGYADFKGNLQYISTGNIMATKKTALILMHYPSRTRLKIWAETEILDPKEHPDLKEKLVVKDYGAVVERLVLYHVKALSWNCPQHIPQRLTIEELMEALPQNPDLAEQLRTAISD